MTEYEAIEIIKYYYPKKKVFDCGIFVEVNDRDSNFGCALDEAIHALYEIRQYREIGTVEEYGEAMEKQKPKKCVEDSRPDHTHYKCPSCGKIQLSTYAHRFSRGRITKYCENCGQALEYENLDMEKKNE